MNRRSDRWNAGLILVLAAMFGLVAASSPAGRGMAQDKAGAKKSDGKKSAADAEKEKALANPYPNDLGPDTLDAETLKSYPADIQEGYKLLRGSDKKRNCQSCHTSARPLNSRFVEPEGKNEAERKDNIAKLKKSNPEMFEDMTVWQIEWDQWQRYVKRMMSKPGCSVSKDDGMKIWRFLVYDSSKRKLGANAEKWKAHRKKLIEEFKQKYPKRYEELAGSKPIDL